METARTKQIALTRLQVCSGDEGFDVSVILPTRCEAENLRVLIPQIAQYLDAAGLRAEIIVVDDDSPDETVAVCESLRQEFPLQLLVRRGQRGLSSAVVHGILKSRGDSIVVMDADLSHPPEQIPALLERLREDQAEFVIGSRYVCGGGTYEGWGLFRWFNSRIATFLARPLTKARDPMAGFFALRRATFAKARGLNPIGYKIGLELIVKCGCRRIDEVPIMFRSRLHGESKLSAREQWAYLRQVGQLYAFKFWRRSRSEQGLPPANEGASSTT